jgi:signal transduction histidine kinase/DNA-binding response OmpR family regulator
VSIKYLQEALRLYQSLNDQENEIQILNLLGTLVNELGDLASGIEFLNKALALSQQLGNKMIEARILNSMGIIYLLPDSQKTLPFFEKAVNISKDYLEKAVNISKDYIANTIAMCYGNIGNVFKNAHDYHRAIEYHDKALQLHQKYKQKRLICIALHNIGSTYFGLKEYETALSYYMQSLKIAKKLKEQRLLIASFRSLGELYAETNFHAYNLGKAVAYLEKALQAAKTANAKIDVWTALPVMVNVYKQKVSAHQQPDDYKRLVEHLEAYQALTYELFNEKSDKKLKALQVIHQVDELQKRMDWERRFFANVSHELRTPLTLMLLPLEELMRRDRDKEEKEALALALQNTYRLQKLVNETLDMAKADAGKLTAQTIYDNLPAFLDSISQPFKALGIKDGIRFHFVTNQKKTLAHFDADKLEKIITNLLSNAFKFSHLGGAVWLRLNVEKGFATISVEDNGIGISKEAMTHLFERFYQVETGKVRQGTGLGLAYVKELIECCGGTIAVESTPDKKTTFRIRMPISQKAFADEPIGQAIRKRNIKQVRKPSDKDKAIILIVEDNQELRGYVRHQLEKDYDIQEAENGADGYEKAVAQVPDVIITDVMMEKMNGYELCEKVKGTVATSHIPVIMLTAKSAIESRLSGYEKGADIYLSKPFNLQELKLNVRNLLKLQEQWRKRYATGLVLGGDEKKPMGDVWIKRLEQVMEKNLSDENYGIRELEKEAALSHMQLYRKLKATIGVSGSEFIQNIRLKKAARLLSEKAGNVSQVAYEVGFRSQTHFSSSFKKLYQMSPKEFYKRNQKI